MKDYKNLLQLYKHPFTLVRLGRTMDGGYVVPKELIGKNLLTCGISNEISFEEDYLKNVNKTNVHCFDGTINEFPSKNVQYNWHKLNIGSSTNNNEISINDIFEKCFTDEKEVFIKMDIEGGEYLAFTTISDENLSKITCLIIEVHWIDNQYEDFEKLINKLTTKLVLIHKHDNNNGRYFEYEGKTIPKVHELTFVNKKYIEVLEKNPIKLPIENLDFVNDPYNESKIIDY